MKVELDFKGLVPALVVAAVSGGASGLVAWGTMRGELASVRHELNTLQTDVRELRGVLLRGSTRPQSTSQQDRGTASSS